MGYLESSWEKFKDNNNNSITDRNTKLKVIRNLRKILIKKHQILSILNSIKGAEEGKENSWAYLWWKTMLINDYFTILPPVNLITNIGFDENSTNNKNVNKHLSYLNTKELDLTGSKNYEIINDVDFEIISYIYPVYGKTKNLYLYFLHYLKFHNLNKFVPSKLKIVFRKTLK